MLKLTFLSNLNGKPTLGLSLVVLVNLVFSTIYLIHRYQSTPLQIPKPVVNIGAHNVSRLFQNTDKVLSISPCDPSTVDEVNQVLSHTQLFFPLQECRYSGNIEPKTLSLRGDLRGIDAVFIDVEHIGKEKLLETLIRFHDKPTKYIAVYRKFLSRSIWADDFAYMNDVGDILDDFMETHVRWQIHYEPFEHKEKSKLENRIFLLRGETQEAWDLIQQHQFPSNCKAQNYFVAEYWTYGWGSYITTTWRTLEVTAQYNKTMLLTNYWTTYARHTELGPRTSQFCETDLPDCYYLKLSNCTLGDALDALHRAYGLVADWQTASKDRNLTTDPVVFTRGHPYDVTAKYWTRGDMWNESRYIDDETHPYFFQFMRNRRYVREIIYDRISTLNLHSRPYVGIHIRHGDKHIESGAFRHLSYYINEAKSIIKNRLCVNNSTCPFNLSLPIPMFVMTDDENELAEIDKFPNVELLYFRTTRHKGEVQNMFTDEQNKNRTETFLTLATELDIMAKSSVYIGTGNSNLSNLLVKIFYRNKPGGLKANLHTLVQGRETQ